MMLDVGILILRLGFGGLLAVQHGLPKLQQWAQYASVFPDPLHIGSKASLAMAIFGELVCGSLLAVGLAARLAAIPPLITMAVAFFVVHNLDPWTKKEMAFVYLVAFLVLALTGPGRLSLDAVIGAKRKVSSYRP